MECGSSAGHLAKPLRAFAAAARQAVEAIGGPDECVWREAARGHAGHQTWEEIVQAALSWKDVADSELFIAVHVFSMLSWAPMCAFRACHSVTANAFELWAGQPQQHVALSWVHVPINRQSDCLRFLGQHCRNARQLTICDTTRFGERQLLRLVCGMRLLESLEVDAPSFGGDFPEPQRLLDRLAKYCPRLQHLALSFRPENPSCRTSLELRALAWLGRRLLTLDLGAVAIRVWGGTRTIAACCPLLQRLCAQLCQQSDPRDAVDPVDIARGCSNIQDLDLAPVDWGNKIVEDFTTQAPGLRRLVLRHVALDATAALLAPLVALGRASQVGGLVNLHLALHARSDTGRALFWLEAISKLKQLRSLCLDYAAPLTLKDILSSLTSSSEGHCSLMSLTVHGCHGVGDAALGHLAACAPKLEQVRLFPDSWRQVGSVTYGLRILVEQLALRSLALSSLSPLDGNQAFDSARALRMRSLSLFAPMTNGFLQTRLWSSWRCLRHLWLGPHKLMQKGVSAECLIDDVGLQSVVETCSMLRDFTVASHRITDEGVRLMLSACRELCRLRCGGCGITDASLQFLATLTQPRLERFSLWFSGVTSQGLHQAEEDMPWTYFDVDIS